MVVHDFLLYISLTRDTGVKILDAIQNYDSQFRLTRCDQKDYIEGEYTLDLDNGIVEMNYHGKKRKYTFDEIAYMDIDSEMERLEGEE